jgi:ribosomal protein S20
LANTQSAIKRIRSAERRRRINQVHRSRARTFVKKTRKLIASGEYQEAEAMARHAVSALDKAAQKAFVEGVEPGQAANDLISRWFFANPFSAT